MSNEAKKQPLTEAEMREVVEKALLRKALNAAGSNDFNSHDNLMQTLDDLDDLGGWDGWEDS